MSLEGKASPGQELKGRINAIDVLTISAYGIAVKHGFKGTEEEWLDSLAMADTEIEQAVTKYLDENPVGIDTTLTVSGVAADAKAAGDAIKAVNAAVEAADEAASAGIAEAKEDAADAMTAASTAQNTADTAVENAEAAQETANTAVVNAAAAQETADEGKADAETAKSAADNAQAAADAAQGTANAAMPKAGGVFVGDVVACGENRDTSSLRNIQVGTGTIDEFTAVATNSIIMVRK